MSGTKLERGQDPWILCPEQRAGVTVSSRASGLGRLALRKLFRTLGGSWGNVWRCRCWTGLTGGLQA